MYRVALVVCVLAALALSYKQLYITSLVVLGRSPGCPYAEALHTFDENKRQVEFKEAIAHGSRELERDAKGYALWETPKGRFWIPAASLGALFWDLAEQERKIYGTGERAVRAGDTVLDCGANIGVYTREALSAGAKLVVAIEPAQENIECLRRTFAPEIAAGRVIVYPKGVWDKDELLTLNVDPVNSAADSFLIKREGSEAREKIPLTTIDEIAGELKLERVDFIKMDIEGAEQRALFGAQKTLQAWRPRMAISVYHLDDDPQKIPAIIGAAVPEYRMECGPCALRERRVKPDVYYFSAR